MSDQFVRGLTGRPYAVGTEQAEGAAAVGAKPISEKEAVAANKAQGDIDYVNKNWSGAEQALGGAFDGGTLGLGPAALASLGLADKWQVEALRGEGAYQAGEVGGMLAPALLTGGESVGARGVVAKALSATPAGALGVAGSMAERLAGRLLPEVGGLGRFARPTLQMAARGAAEGSLINMSHTVSDSVIQDKPLTWASIAASGRDGALLGGLAGGALGGISALGGGAVDAIAGRAAGAGGSGEVAAARALKRVGADEAELASLSANGGVASKAAAFDDILQKGGESFASSTSTISKVVRQSEADNIAIRNHVVETLDREAPSMVPNLNRVEGRVQADLDAKFAGTVQQGKVGRALGSLKEDMAPLGSYAPRKAFEGVEPAGPQPFTRPAEPLPPKPWEPSWWVEDASPFAKAEPVKPVSPPGGVKVSPQAMQAYEAELRAYKAEKEVHDFSEKGRFAAEKKTFDEEHKLHNKSENKRFTDEHRAIAKAEEAHHVSEAQRFARETRDYAAAKKAHEALPEMIRQAGAGGTWESWTKTARQLGEMEAKAQGVTREVYRTAKQAVEAEIRASMDVASDSIGRVGLSKQYSGALFGETMAREFGAMIGKRTGTELGARSAFELNSGDMGSMAYSTIFGHPLGGAAIVLGKKIVGYGQRKLEPVLAEAAYRASLGATAQASTINVGKRISESLKNFMVGSTRAIGTVGATKSVKYDRSSYEKALASTESLLSSVHQAKVAKLARDIESMGHADLATEALACNQRAVDYLRFNMPAGKALKQATSLTRQAKPFGLTTKEMRFLRIDAAIKDPVGTITGGLKRGDLSRDQVKAIKYVYPPLHADLTMRAAQEILDVKSSGKFLPEDKVAMIGLVLDAPLDSRLEKEFIDSVQKAHVANAAPPPQKQEGSTPIAESTAFQTPLQNTLG